MTELVLLSIGAFTVTNIDDLFLLMGFFAEPKGKAHDVVLGQFAGILLLVAISLLLSWAAVEILPSSARYLGILPILLGLKGIWDLREEEEANHRTPRLHRVFLVAAITLSNGADNLGVYVPFFAVRSLAEKGVVVAVFLAMTALWCALAHFLANHPVTARPIRVYSRYVFPFLLIGIGVMILRTG